ncbi:hypothetical protein BX616_007348 [Lobosporangium transversale]|nr:hypothetical protein BX616_007348 [Lobosporangium transversale]
MPKRVMPKYLEDELIAFKAQYDRLTLHLEHAGQFAEHALQVASYLEKHDELDFRLSAIANELRAEREATTEAIVRAMKACADFEKLTEDLKCIFSTSPRPSDKTPSTVSLALKAYKIDLEVSLRNRLTNTESLKDSLEPLLVDYKSLLRYQDRLRAYIKGLEGHKQWLDPANEKIQRVNERMQMVFKSWPNEGMNANDGFHILSSSVDSSNNHNDKGGFADLEAQLKELNALKTELEQVLALVRDKEQDFQVSKDTINQTLLSATAHSRQLQVELKNAIELIESRIQSLRSDIRHKSDELKCLQKQTAWEQELKDAQDWCRTFDIAVANFVEDQAQWKDDRANTGVDGSSIMDGSTESAVIEELLRRLDAKVLGFEGQLKEFEDQIKPSVEKTWTDFCGSLVYLDRGTVPGVFENQQASLGKKYQELWSKIMYSAEVVKQRRVLERLNARMNDLSQLKADLAAMAVTNINEITIDGDKGMQKLEAKIRALGAEFEAGVATLCYPVDASSDESRMRFEDINSQVRRHIQVCRTRLENFNQTLNQVLHDREVMRKQQKLEAIQQSQNEAIHVKTQYLEDASSLVEWVNEATILVARVFSGDERDVDSSEEGKPTTSTTGSLVEEKNVDHLLFTAEELCSRFSQEELRERNIRLEKLYQGVHEKTEHKKDMQVQFLESHTADKQESELKVHYDRVLSLSEPLVADNATFSSESSLYGLQENVKQNRSTIEQLDRDISSKFYEFDAKAEAMLVSLEQQSKTLEAALEERMRLDEEERLRALRAIAIGKFDSLKVEFLTWSDNQIKGLTQLWDSYGYIAKNEGTLDNAVKTLETETERIGKELSNQESVYHELKDTLDTLFSSEEYVADHKRHAEAIDSAWSSLKADSNGYTTILNHMYHWLALHNALYRFKKELSHLEQRVEALPSMDWNAFLTEEEAVRQRIMDLEKQAHEIMARADEANAIKFGVDIQAKLHKVLNANKAYFEEQLSMISGHMETVIERIKLEKEIAHEKESERLRVLRAIAVEEFEASKHKFLTWSDNQIKGLTQLWDSYGYIAKNEGTLDNAVKTLETETERIGKELSNQESVYHELKDTLDTLFSSEEYVADHKRHAEAIDSAWSSLKADSNGYTTILNHMNHWLALYNNLVRFEKEGLGRLDRRVEALRWMHWDAFQPEEEALQQCIKDVEDQARDLLIRADEVNAMGLGSNIQADHQAILNANRVYFEEYFSKIPNRIKSAKAQMEIIHETAKEIALHAKFHADLVRVETAIAQQIDAVKARLGSLERSSCFALNSRALEAVVVAANEVCMDGKYQFSVLQEVEYPALEQMAFDLDMLTVPEPADADGNISSIRTGVQGSMERIRDSLKKLEVYIEEDCFETLLAAKFYTHCKATEDIRQWITACRESMAQLDPFLSSRNEDLGDKAKRQQTKDWKTHHLESLEKKMNAFGGTVQHYDDLSSDFMLLHHPDTSALDLTDQVAGTTQEEGTPPISMRVILRQTVQERTKRTREDWELLKQEFLAKTAALDEMNSEDGNASEVSDLNGTDLGEHGRRGSSADNGTIPVVKAKALSRFGKEILEDITRVSREVQEMFDYVPSSHSALSLAMGSDGTLIKSKDGQVRLEMIEAYIRDVLRAKVERFDAMLLAANEQNEQEQACLENGNTSDQGISTRSQMRHHERMVGVAMQRGLIAESMSRLVESCNHQRKEVEETDRVRDAMGLIHEASMLCDEMAKALSTADGLLTLSTTCGMPTSVSLYSLPSTSSSSVSVASIHNAKSPIASPRMSPATTVSRATAISRERRASRAAKRRSFSLSSLSEEDAQQWEANYCGLMKELDRFTQDIEQRLDAVSNMADHLNDWRLDENYGITTEHWQRLKKSALAKKEELDRIRVGRSGSSTASNELNQGSGVHPLDGQLSLSSRPSVMQPTISSSNRAKTNLGTPLEPSSSGQQSSEKKRFSTGNIVSRGPPVPPSTASGGSRSSTSRSTTSGRMRSGTAPGRATASQTDVSTPKKYTNIGVSPSLSSLHGMSATFSQETKRRPSVVHKNDEAMALVPSLAQNNNSNGGNLDVPNSSTTSKQRMVYKPDLDNALDVEVARVVNASGFLMKVKRVKDSQSPYLSASGNSTGANTPGGGMARSRSDSASSLVLSGLSDNGGYEGGTDGIDISSPRAMKVIRDQGQNRLNVSKLENNGIDEYNGQVGRYVFGEIEPKVCYCRILRSRKVMVRIGGGWCELSKFMEDHASLEQRKAKAKLLSASNSSVSMYHFGGSAPVLSGTESGPANHTSVGGLDGSSDSLSAHSQMSGGDIGGGGSGVESHEGSSHVQETSKRNKKEVVYAIRPSDDLALKTIKFVKNGAGEGLVAI